MITQITEAIPTCSARWISGNARTTIVVSTAVISTPVTMTSSARPVRVVEVDCSAPEAEGDPAGDAFDDPAPPPATSVGAGSFTASS